MSMDFLTDIKPLHNLYQLFFRFLENQSLRSSACHILFLLTRRCDVLPYRITKLQSILSQNLEDPSLNALAHLFTLYDSKATCLPQRKKSLQNVKPFKNPNRPWYSSTMEFRRQLIQNSQINDEYSGLLPRQRPFTFRSYALFELTLGDILSCKSQIDLVKIAKNYSNDDSMNLHPAVDLSEIDNQGQNAPTLPSRSRGRPKRQQTKDLLLLNQLPRNGLLPDDLKYLIDSQQMIRENMDPLPQTSLAVQAEKLSFSFPVPMSHSSYLSEARVKRATRRRRIYEKNRSPSNSENDFTSMADDSEASLDSDSGSGDRRSASPGRERASEKAKPTPLDSVVTIRDLARNASTLVWPDYSAVILHDQTYRHTLSISNDSHLVNRVQTTVTTMLKQKLTGETTSLQYQCIFLLSLLNTNEFFLESPIQDDTVLLNYIQTFNPFQSTSSAPQHLRMTDALQRNQGEFKSVEEMLYRVFGTGRDPTTNRTVQHFRSITRSVQVSSLLSMRSKLIIDTLPSLKCMSFTELYRTVLKPFVLQYGLHALPSYRGADDFSRSDIFQSSLIHTLTDLLCTWLAQGLSPSLSSIKDGNVSTDHLKLTEHSTDVVKWQASRQFHPSFNIFSQIPLIHIHDTRRTCHQLAGFIERFCLLVLSSQIRAEQTNSTAGTAHPILPGKRISFFLLDAFLYFFEELFRAHLSYNSDIILHPSPLLVLAILFHGDPVIFNRLLTLLIRLHTHLTKGTSTFPIPSSVVNTSKAYYHILHYFTENTDDNNKTVSSDIGSEPGLKMEQKTLDDKMSKWSANRKPSRADHVNHRERIISHLAEIHDVPLHRNPRLLWESIEFGLLSLHPHQNSQLASQQLLKVIFGLTIGIVPSRMDHPLSINVPSLEALIFDKW
ncbi:putative centromere protein I [Blattamonas nauphoetae]|uniref:Centromere protein I n=1 Tax=Blattamonas nauphoetae TaxID=2049346 RepID=A0ABQ9XA28_9EUKA|nr:putative centromere protein I [Blattamonas nauphoetae]